MRNKAIDVEVPIRLWTDLSFALLRSNDRRKAHEVVALAIRDYLATHFAKPTGRGYQWKELFLMVTGTIRNAWRDIWIRRNVSEGWTRAAEWREQYSGQTLGVNRRRTTRRIDD